MEGERGQGSGNVMKKNAGSRKTSKLKEVKTENQKFLNQKKVSVSLEKGGLVLYRARQLYA